MVIMGGVVYREFLPNAQPYKDLFVSKKQHGTTVEVEEEGLYFERK